MKSLWKTILDGLTYKDLAGKRQPRAYTVLTGLILLLLFGAGGMAGLNRYLLMSRVQATPVSVSLTTTAAETLEAEPTATMQPNHETSYGCPTDPAEWSLTPTYASQTYHVIQPACVYQGLEKTIAWALAVREGYSRAEATQQLSFTEMPMRRLDQLTIPLDGKGLADVPVSFIPPNPDLTEWRLNANGDAAVTYALRGCFRTSTIEGNRVEIWGGDYSVICLVVEDAENTYIVYSLDGHAYTSSATPMRSFLLFGYLEDGLWVWLGTKQDPRQEITDPESFANERLTIATMYDSQPWDAKWLSSHYHLDMQSPPENWQALKDENEKQAILNALSNDVSGVAP
jgi:Tfp pilus assembly protein PilX